MTPPLEHAYRYCPLCGGVLTAKLIKAGEPKRLVCGGCEHVVYLDPKVAVGTIIRMEDDRIILVRRAIEPGFGKWVFPGGYVDRGEAVEHAAVREVREETNLDVETTGLLGVYSSNGSPVALVAYAARVTGGVLRAGDEAQDARFFPVDALPELPFPHDDQILKDWREKKQLKNQQT